MDAGEAGVQQGQKAEGRREAYKSKIKMGACIWVLEVNKEADKQAWVAYRQRITE